MKIYFIIVLIATALKGGNAAESISTPAPGQRRSSSTRGMLQQILQQISTLENENQRQSGMLQELNRATARLEVQRQELVTTIDRAESRLSQRLDDIKGDIHKVITLQEVLREDVDKVQQNQMLNKVWLEEQIRQIEQHHPPEKEEISSDHVTSMHATSDVVANLQIVQTTLYGLRRMTDNLQNGIGVIKANITDLNNITRQMYQRTEDTVTKSYLLSTLRSFDDEKENPQILSCASPQQYKDILSNLPVDCSEIEEENLNRSGIYRIQPKYTDKPFFVYCDLETDGGGWTVIQRRKDGSIDFLREWIDYKYGFGNVGGEFWLGNEKIHLLTIQDLYEVRIDLYDFEDNHAHTKYDAFLVGNEKERYMLKMLGTISGDAGDGMSYHVSMPFSTVDADNDRWTGGNCAKDHTGGWWYNQCDASNLNGQYLGGLNQQEYKGVYWYEWQGPNYSLRSTEMKIRPHKRK